MFVRKDSLGELSDTRRGLLAQEDMLRLRLKFSLSYNFVLSYFLTDYRILI